MIDIISKFLFAIPLAVAPCIAIVFFIYFRDKYEKEPYKLLRNSYLFGMLCIIPAIIIEEIFIWMGVDDNKGLLTTLIFAFLVVGLNEEVCKFTILKTFAFPKKDFNDPFDGIVYSVMISMGFATVENIIYSLSLGVESSLLRMFTAVPLHAVCAIFMGFFVGKAKFSQNKMLNYFYGITIATLVHGLYDFFLFQKNNAALAILSFVVLGASIAITFLAINHHQKKSPFNPHRAENNSQGL